MKGDLIEQQNLLVHIKLVRLLQHVISLIPNFLISNKQESLIISPKASSECEHRKLNSNDLSSFLMCYTTTSDLLEHL
jgi:hypothetical protein